MRTVSDRLSFAFGVSFATAFSFAIVLAVPLFATQPPRPVTGAGDEPGFARAAPPVDLSAFEFRRALMPLMVEIQANRRQLVSSLFSDESGSESVVGPTSVIGEREIPVLLARYSDVAADPYPPENLRRELFSQEWPVDCEATQSCTGTLTQYYSEISYGKFTVAGEVFPWAKLAKRGVYYHGGEWTNPKGEKVQCAGLCPQNRVGEFIREIVAANEGVEWERYDNDGPDGVANSGDDDGFVDFVAFVHPGIGGECADGTAAIWSHRYSLAWLTGSDLETERQGVNGPIRIDDYVIMPARACTGTRMIEIGVFAHEFGHAFGLPDLYDTSDGPNRTAGLGNWCLMASGSWGGDGNSPERPVHMSAWAKHFLGWISLKPVAADGTVTLRPIETHPEAAWIPISNNQFYLVSHIRRAGFDSRLPADGLAIWQVNRKALEAGLASNTVCARKPKGIDMVEADGNDGLDDRDYGGTAADLFPGSSGNLSFDNQTRPRSVGKTAVCDMTESVSGFESRMLVSEGLCDRVAAGPALLPDPVAPPVFTVPEIATRGASFESDRVRVLGRIENAGGNYFLRAGRRFVIEGENGQQVEIRLPLVFEAGPAAPGMPAPPTAADLMGREVEVTAVVRVKADGGPVLDVSRAELLGEATADEP